MRKEYCVKAEAVIDGEETTLCIYVHTNCPKNAIVAFKHDICELKTLYESDLKNIRSELSSR